MSCICPKFKGTCVDEHGMRFVDCCGDPTKCIENGGNAITVGEWIEYYKEYQQERHRCRPGTVKSNLSTFETFRRYLNIPTDMKTSCITRDLILKFWDMTANDLQPVTRKGVVDIIKTLSPNDFREWLKGKGKSLPDMPSSRGLRGDYERYEAISSKSKKTLGDLRFSYRNLPDPRKWMALTLGLCHGMSKADVLRSTWDMFHDEGDYILLSYHRNKTGKPAAWGVGEEDWREWRRVKTIMQSTHKYCARWNIRGTQNSLFRIPIAPKDRCVESEILQSVNKDLRDNIPEWKNDSKAFHNLRKEFATYVCGNFDWETAEHATGDTVEILRKSYVGKKVMDWRVMRGVRI